MFDLIIHNTNKNIKYKVILNVLKYFDINLNIYDIKQIIYLIKIIFLIKKLIRKNPRF